MLRTHQEVWYPMFFQVKYATVSEAETITSPVVVQSRSVQYTCGRSV